jgi:hypothetical protein
LLQCGDDGFGSTAADMFGVGDDANGRNAPEAEAADRSAAIAAALLVGIRDTNYVMKASAGQLFREHRVNLVSDLA